MLLYKLVKTSNMTSMTVNEQLHGINEAQTRKKQHKMQQAILREAL